jgi:hypothetical protein
MFCCASSGDTVTAQEVAVEPAQEEPVAKEPAPVPEKEEPEAAKVEPEPVTGGPEPAKVEQEPVKPPEPAEPGTYVVELEKKSDADKVGLNISMDELVVKAINAGLIKTYNETAASDKVVKVGDSIIEVTGLVTTRVAKDMIEQMGKSQKLRLVFKSI